MPIPAAARRVVITGLGAVTPIGLDTASTWRAMLGGMSGAADITRFDTDGYGTTFACEVKGFDPLGYMDRKLARRLDLVCQFAIAAADEALRDAGLAPETIPDSLRNEIGVVFGTGIGGIQTFQDQAEAWVKGGPRKISPFFIPMMIPDMTPGIISIQYGLRGPNHCVVSACATGNHNLADAIALVRAGHANVIVTGGSEAAICELGVGGFVAMHALSTRNDSPATASRPFDATRDGFVMGEGAGALIVESLDHALARGATIYAEVLAVGASADAYHLTAPHPEGLGARLAMERALAEAGLAPDDVDTINMHGTSTPLGDVAESAAIRAVFGAHADPGDGALTATSTKSMTGHMLGAAGAVEALASVLSLVDQVVPPTINHTHADPECTLHYAFNTPEHRTADRPLRVALSNAFGFGGHNTTAVFAAYDGPNARGRSPVLSMPHHAPDTTAGGPGALDPTAAW
jgi:3-oxoacyl-[acyl-carrier-protein] synthase II